MEFLSDEQAEAYGTFAEEPTRPELERFFFLDDVDRDLIALRRTEHRRLGFALQMCTVRYVGLFLEDPLAVPWPVIEHLAVQLGIEDPSVVKRYTERRQTLYDHAWEIRDAYGYHPYEDAEWGRRFRTFLHGRAWTHAEGPKAASRPRGGLAAPSRGPAARGVRAGPAGVGGAYGRGEAAARHRRGRCPPRGPGAARGSGGDAEDAGGLAVLGAGAAAPAADADDGHGVRPRAGADGRDRRVPARQAEAVADPAEPDGGAGPVRAGVEGAAAGAGGGTEAHGDARRGDAAPGGEGNR
nr:DUF4158 domain-containing protein [Streptomyces wedmorensis]